MEWGSLLSIERKGYSYMNKWVPNSIAANLTHESATCDVMSSGGVIAME